MQLRTIHNALIVWYNHAGRKSLPWRQTSNAYNIWVSEIMLQQTQVKTVLERFYFPFLEAFPTLEDLATANLDDVLKQWEGLGYYTRARNLHKSAQICKTALPKRVDELIALPGIGKSTAHAIASFAYRQPYPILDANVKRILYRIFGLKKATETVLWQKAYQLYDAKNIYIYNQAMMDIGATICMSKVAHCHRCIFEPICLASSMNPLEFPQKKRKATVPKHFINIIIESNNERYKLEKRNTKLLHGLWGFTQVERESLKHETECFLGHIKHQYSHFHLDVMVYFKRTDKQDCSYFTREQINSLALSKVDAKALHLLDSYMVELEKGACSDSKNS